MDAKLICLFRVSDDRKFGTKIAQFYDLDEIEKIQKALATIPQDDGWHYEIEPPECGGVHNLKAWDPSHIGDHKHDDED